MKHIKIITLLLSLIIVLNICPLGAMADSKVTMYSMDGRTISVNPWDVSAYRNVGWYTNINDVKTTMYSEDGRSIDVWKSKVEEYKNVGWYENISDVKTTMYSDDGRSIEVWNSEVEAYYEVGWYDDIEDARTTLCSIDGRYIVVWNSEVNAYISAGWYPMVEMFDIDGNMTLIRGFEVEDYKKVGWYTFEEFAFKWLENEYNSYKSSGDYISALKDVSDLEDIFWGTEYEYPVMKMKCTAMDVLRNRTGQPVVIEGYSVDGGELEVAFRNVSYKDIIALKFTFESSDIFGDVIEWAYETNYIVDDTYIASGDSDIFIWDVDYDTKWIKNVDLITVVFSDGTIWNG